MHIIYFQLLQEMLVSFQFVVALFIIATKLWVIVLKVHLMASFLLLVNSQPISPFMEEVELEVMRSIFLWFQNHLYIFLVLYPHPQIDKANFYKITLPHLLPKCKHHHPHHCQLIVKSEDHIDDL